MNSLKNGFINYFGHQRFGTDSTVKTSDIGLALVKNQWESAVELILKPRPNETHQLTRFDSFLLFIKNFQRIMLF